MTEKTKKRPQNERASTLIETLQTIGYALLIALFVRAFLFQPFNIPSGSMLSTLLVGDYLFVSKYAYGFSRHSLPFSPPIFEGRIFESVPERGDIIVFKLPTDNRTDFIKRLIGLPGDEIQMRGGVLYINGEAVKKERVDDFIKRDKRGGTVRAPRYRETLPNGVSYMVLDLERQGRGDNTGVYKVPPGHYFMMGDNRDDSSDSRVPSAVGFVPAENLVGRAEIIFFSTDGSARLWEVWRWFSAARWERMFDMVDLN